MNSKLLKMALKKILTSAAGGGMALGPALLLADKDEKEKYEKFPMQPREKIKEIEKEKTGELESPDLEEEDTIREGLEKKQKSTMPLSEMEELSKKLPEEEDQKKEEVRRILKELMK